MSWETKLREPIRLKDGRWLRTCREAAAIIVALPELRQKAPHWEYTAELLMAAAEKNGDRADLYYQLLRALQAEGMLAPPRPTPKKSDIKL